MTAGAGSGPGRGVRPGQEGWAAVLFTTLGMLAVMNKILRLLEAEMKMDELVQGFMVASLGVQLVEPFYANTISTISKDSSLKKFFISLRVWKTIWRKTSSPLPILCSEELTGSFLRG